MVQLITAAIAVIAGAMAAEPLSNLNISIWWYLNYKRRYGFDEEIMDEAYIPLKVRSGKSPLCWIAWPCILLWACGGIVLAEYQLLILMILLVPFGLLGFLYVGKYLFQLWIRPFQPYGEETLEIQISILEKVNQLEKLIQDKPQTEGALPLFRRLWRAAYRLDSLTFGQISDPLIKNALKDKLKKPEDVLIQIRDDLEFVEKNSPDEFQKRQISSMKSRINTYR